MPGAKAPSAARGGIDLGGTKIEAVVVDARNKVLGSARRPTPTSGKPEGVASQMADAVGEAAEAGGLEPAALTGVGVGSPGIVDPASGAVSGARNLPGWEGSFELASALSKAIGTRVAVGNDVQVATDAEFKLGAGKPYKSILGVFWGTGVGGGIILNGKPWIGRGEMRLRPPRLHGGVRWARIDGGARATARREGAQDRPVQADGGARP